MPVLDPVKDDHATGKPKELFQTIQARFGIVPNVFRTMGHAPSVLEATLGMNAAVATDLPPKFRELAYLKASQLNNCEYCMHYHKMSARSVGLSEAQIEDLPRYQQSPAFTSEEKTILQFAEQWTREGKVAPNVMNKVRGFLSPSQLVLLAATVGLANWTNRFNVSFDCELP